MNEWSNYILKDDPSRSLQIKNLKVRDVLLLGSTSADQLSYLQSQTTEQAVKEDLSKLRSDIIPVLVKLCLGTRDYKGFNGVNTAQTSLEAFLGGDPVIANFWPEWVDEVLAAVPSTNTTEDEEKN